MNTHQTEEADGDVGAPKEWYSRGYLPHRDARELPENQRSTRRREKIEHWLDAGMGCCALRHPKLAEQMSDSLQHFDGQRYQLIAWCIMPNHVHVLLETLAPRKGCGPAPERRRPRRHLRTNLPTRKLAVPVPREKASTLCSQTRHFLANSIFLETARK